MDFFVRAFPLWVSIGAALALVHPPLFTWFERLGLIGPGLQVIMLGMGLTLTLDDFVRVARAPRAALLGLLLQYTVMPAAGYGVATLMRLPPSLAAGLILVCCCPGGTASNVITYLARADVPLSVSMTSLSTLLAALATPALTTWLVGSRVSVDGVGLVVETAKVVLLPIALGLALRRFAPRLTERLLPVAPPAAVLAIVLIVSAVLGVRRDEVLSAGPALLASVALAHALGFGLGYLCAGLVEGFGAAARTISIEVGMQNSGLGVALANASFPATPLVAVPPALSAVFHCVMGSLLAALWARRPVGERGTDPGSSPELR